MDFDEPLQERTWTAFLGDQEGAAPPPQAGLAAGRSQRSAASDARAVMQAWAMSDEEEEELEESGEAWGGGGDPHALAPTYQEQEEDWTYDAGLPQAPYQAPDRKAFRSSPAYFKSSAATITLPRLQAHFHLSIVDAAKSLGVCRTTLKSVCRTHGIMRWPKRKMEVGGSLVPRPMAPPKPKPKSKPKAPKLGEHQRAALAVLAGAGLSPLPALPPRKAGQASLVEAIERGAQELVHARAASWM